MKCCGSIHDDAWTQHELLVVRRGVAQTLEVLVNILLELSVSLDFVLQFNDLVSFLQQRLEFWNLTRNAGRG